MKLLVAILGPSCSGKDTLADSLVSEMNKAGHDARRVVRCTTRPRRHGEGDDRYTFMTPEQFMLYANKPESSNDRIFEMSRYRNWCYGTRYSDISDGVVNVGVFDRKHIELVRATVDDMVVLYTDAHTRDRLRRYEARDGRKSIEMYRRAMSDALTMRRLPQALRERGYDVIRLPPGRSTVCWTGVAMKELERTWFKK